MPEITKNQLKLIRSLRQKKNRKENGLFIVEGEKNVAELLASSFSVKWLFATNSWEGTYPDVIPVSSKQLSQLSNLSTPDKVLAVAEIPSTTRNVTKGFTLILDNINDPGNLGTIIRTADWFGVNQVICSLNTVDCFNPKVVQATKGSLFNVNIQYVELESYLANYKHPVYAATLDGEEEYTVNKQEQKALIMGSESHGLSPNLEQFVTKKIKIGKKGKAESLNVAIATGILLHQFN